jgi:site-specific DNA recombinase
LESEIATGETVTNVIELHPQVVQRFKENIEALANILTTKDGLPDLDLIGTFRSPVERVVVHPRKPGDEYSVSIRGFWTA